MMEDFGRMLCNSEIRVLSKVSICLCAEHPGRPVAHLSCPGVRYSNPGDEGWAYELIGAEDVMER